MKHTTIPAGYRLTVTSWENDADHYKTKTMEGLSEQETRFLVDLISLLGNRCYGKQNFGNMYEPSDQDIADFTAAVQAVVAKHDLENPRFVSHFETLVDPERALDGVNELLYELGLCGGDFYTRVLDAYKVEYLPEEIKIQNVTDQFPGS